MCEQCTRRGFMGTSAAGGLLLAGATWTHAWASESPRSKPREKSRICVIFTGTPQPEDRNWGADIKQIEAMKTRLAEAEKKLGNIELVIGQVKNPEETKALLEKAGSGSPVLAINVQNFAMTRVIGPVLDGGHPMAVFSLPASGHDWMYAPRWLDEGHRVALLASSDHDELERALRLLRVVPMMRRTRVLLFPPARGTKPACSPEEVKKRLGADVVAVKQKEFDNRMEAVDEAAVQAEAKAWTKGAKEIIEPTKEDITKAARVSIALDRLVDEEEADGLAVGTCMGWLERGFPCLAFARLRDRGIPAACEGDMDSVLTMLLAQYAFDLPGFQGNATFDTSRNALWTAHCTAPLKMDGADGEEAPYLLRGHSEVRGDGCVPEVQYRLGEVITRAKLVNLDTILASTGEIIDVPERAVHGCRTQIVTEVKDAAKMAAGWSSALDTSDAMTLLHRVVFYGDHMQSLRHLANLTGMKVLREG
ncbi:MAG: twin-arginine translocation signal domain-containing protein [Planctomycetota bacterium]